MTKKLLLFIGIVFFTNILTASTPPKIFNFRIEASEPDRVYFDSDQPISGSSINGFTISNRSINSISINDGQLSNHYITVNNIFTFWDNNTVRYEGGSDVSNSDNTPLAEFALTYIMNNIPEPETSKDRYVTAYAGGGGDGTSEDSAWTLSEGFAYATTGTTVWVKAGNYGNENISLRRDGNAVNPIKFVGYRNYAGDINSMYYSYGDGNLDASEMPLLSGDSGDAIVGGRVDYIIIRNFQIQNYDVALYNNGGTGVIFDNSIIKEGASRHFGYGFYVSGGENCRITNSIAINVTGTNFSISGSGNLMKNLKSYSNNYSNPTDYYFGMGGNDNISINTYAKRDGNLNHTGHGMSVQTSAPVSNGTDPERTQYNLVEDHTGVNMGKILEFRHGGVRNNVGRNIKGYPEGSGSSEAGWIEIRDNASSNIIENSVIESPTGVGVYFSESVEIGVGLGHNNIIRNTIFKNSRSGIYAQSDNNLGSLTNNKFYNNVFYNVDLIIHKGNSNFDMSGNEFVNNIVVNSSDLSNISLYGWSFENSNFYNSFSVPSGANNVSFDPKFVSNNDFHLTEDTPIEIAEGGQTLTEVQSDFDGESRSPYYSMGAYEYGESTTGSVNVDAGSDTEICNGSETILNATGSGEFLWSTGETTASITVSPEETTTYTVTLTEDGNSASDEVIVTVNEPPMVTLGEDVTTCLGSEVTLTAVGEGTFLWSTGETGESIIVNPTETSTYTVTATVNCGDEDLSVMDTVIVNVNSDLVVTAGVDITSCAGTEVILTAEGTADFLWSTGETTASITVNPNETTTYTVTSTNGDCTISDDVIVTITEQPQANLGDDLTICYGSDVNLTVEGNGDFLWSTGETTTSINVNPIETTEYIVTASVQCGTEVLTVSDTIVVNVTPELTLSISDDVAFCTNQEVTISANSNGSVLWSTGETTNDIVVNPTETTVYSVTSSLGDCTLTDEITVTISDQPSLDLGEDVTICSGDEVTLKTNGNGSFLWSTGSTRKRIKVSPTETTEYIVTASIDCGTETLSVSDTIVVNVVEGVTLTVTDNQTICAGNEVILTAEGNADFLWSTGETTASISVSPTETTTFTVSSGSGDCMLSEDVIVTVQEAPEVNLGDDIAICSGEVITLTAEGAGSFLWSTGETTKDIVVNPSETTIYSVTATSNCGGNEVSVTDEISINVSENITLTVSDNVTTCSGSEVILTAEGNGEFLWSTGETTASITVNPTETTTYAVTSGSGTCALTENVVVNINKSEGVSLGEDVNICYGDEISLIAEGNGNFLWSTGATTKTILVRPLSTTTYTVSTTTCDNTIVTDDIVVNVGPEININAGADKTMCKGESVTLTAQGNGSFLWSTGETTASISVSPNSTKLYWVSSSIDNCSATDEVFVYVEDTPSVNLGEDVSICEGERITLVAEGNGNFLWSTGQTTSTISVKPNTTTTYSVISSSTCNADATDEITVFVNPLVNANAGDDVSIEQGETVTLTATGGNSYLWSTGETTASINVQPESTTTYTVEVDNGTDCKGVDDVKVEVVDNIALIINDGKDITICKGDELILKARGSLNYLWNTGDMESTISIYPESTTTYTVTAQKNGILETVDVKVTVEDCSNKKVVENNVYPNPTDGIININIPSQKTNVRIIVSALNGKVVYQNEFKADKNGVFTQVNLSRFANGIYLVRMYNENFNETKKIILI